MTERSWTKAIPGLLQPEAATFTSARSAEPSASRQRSAKHKRAHLLWNCSIPLARAALLLAFGAGWAGFAQAPAGSISVKLTDLYSKPVEGASVTLRNRTTGTVAHSIVVKGGVYRFDGLEPGEYTLDALSPRLGQGSLDGIEVTAWHEARVQAAVAFTPVNPSGGPTVARLAVPAVATEASLTKPLKSFGLGEFAALVSPQIRPEASAPVADVTFQTAPMKTLPPRVETPNQYAQRATPVPPDRSTAPEVGNPVSDTSIVAISAKEVLPELTGPLPAIIGSVAAVGSAKSALTSLQTGLCLAQVAGSAANAALRMTEKTPKSALEIARSVADSAAVATTIPAVQLQALPLPERNWQNFVLDQPEQAAEEDADNPFAVRGVNQASAMMVDGVDTRLGFGSPGTGRMKGQSPSLIGPGASEAAIREVQTATGAAGLVSARLLDGRVGVQTERGGDKFHGRAFVFDRENVWGAQNPFTQWVQQTAPATLTTIPVFTPTPYTPGDQERRWGFGLGGPLYWNKLFWYGAVDGFERNAPGVSVVKHPDNFFAQPSNDQMQVLSARLGLSSANPVAAGLGAYSKMLETLAGLLGPAQRTSTQWAGFVRGDWVASQRQRFTIEGTGALADSPGGGLTHSSEDFGAHSYASRRSDDQWILGRWEASPTRNLLAVTQASIGRQYLTTPPDNPSQFEQSLIANSWGRLPQINADSRYGFTIGNPALFGAGAYPDEHIFEGQEQLDWAHGSGMLLRAGFEFRHNNDDTTFLRNQTGTYNYSSVENFASDAMAFAAFGLNGQLNPMNQHNCDQTGKVWRDSAGTLHGLGYLPCYSWYSQTIGPNNWWLSNNDWAGFVTSQWSPRRTMVASLAMRWDLEQPPPALALLSNSDLPLTQKSPTLGSQWGPRASLAWGKSESHWPVLHLGYGLFFGRTPNATFEDALTQTGSLKGDMKFFMRPTDNLNTGGAPPFPYVLAGEPGTVVKPGAVEFAPGFRNGEVHHAVASLEETLPGHVHVDASAIASLGRRLPITLDANIDPTVNPQTITYAVVDANGSGPIKTPQITVPFFASWLSADSSTGLAGRLNPNYQQVTEILSSANSTYEAAILRVTRTARSGLTLHARYTYAHSMDWNPNESAIVNGPSVFDPTDLRADYGTSSLDVRHSLSTAVIWEPRWKLQGELGRLANGWILSEVGSFRSGLPYTMRTAGSLAKEFGTTGTAIVGLAPGMNGYGGDNRVYGIGRNTFRYPATWKADLRLARRFNLGSMRQLELLTESFNLFNHQNVTELEAVGYTIESGSVNGGLPTLNFLTGLKTGQTEFGQPLNVNANDFYRPRQIQFGMRVRF